MVWGHHLRVRACPPLFCKFQQLNVNVAAAHHPISQKEVDELLVRGMIEPSSGGAGFYSSVFVVSEHTGGLWPILSLKHFNHFMHIPSFMMQTIRHVWQCIQCGDYSFSINLQDAYLHIPIVKHHHHFLQFVWHNVPYQWKVLPFGLAMAPQVFTALTKPILFLCCCKGFCIVIYLHDILVLVHSKPTGRGAHLFLCSLLVLLGLHINFSKSDLYLTQTFCLLGLCWDTVCMPVSLPPDNLADIQQLALSLLQNQNVTVHRVMSFSGKTNFCTSGHCQLCCLCCVIQSDMLHVYHSPTHLFSCAHFSLSSLHQLEQLSHLQQSPVPLQFPLPDVIATDATPTHWAFNFQGSGLPLSVSRSWSGSMSRAHIALQEIQAIAMMLHRMAFHLSGKVVALHLDNSTATAYLCNQGGTVSPFLSRLACQILSLANKHGITLIAAYIPIHLNVEADYLSQDWMLPEWHFLPQMAQAPFHLWGLPEVDLLVSSCSTQCQHYYTLESPLLLGALGLNAFNHPWMFQLSYVFPLPALVPLVLSKFLAVHVKGQLRRLILVAP